MNYLNTHEIPASKGGIWGTSSIQRILTNEVYTGQNVYCKYEMKKIYNDINNMTDRTKKLVKRDETKWERNESKSHEPIIDDKTFETAQNVRLLRGGGRRGGIRNKVNVFAGFIYCQDCGSAMVSMKSKGGKFSKEDKEYRYLICSTRRRQGERGCRNNLWVPYLPFRDTIFAELSSKLKKMINISEIVNANVDRLTSIKQLNYDKDIKRLDRQIENSRKMLFELRKSQIAGEVDRSQFDYERAAYEQEIQRCQKQINKLSVITAEKHTLEKIQIEIREGIHDLVHFKNQDFDRIRLVLQKIIDKIYISRSGVIVLHTPLG